MKITFKVAAHLVFLANFLWASNARIESMGKHATFFMDDISIFDNPANINVFPNFLIGELGSFLPNSYDTLAQKSGSASGVSLNNPRYNRDPAQPWFGGLFSYSLSDKTDGNMYPQVSIGGALNRQDLTLLGIVPAFVVVDNDTSVVPKPATNFDGFLGFTSRDGIMVGAHMYLAIQDGANIENGEIPTAEQINPSKINLYVTRWDLGVNMPLTRSVDGEVSVGFATIQYGPSSLDPEASFFVKMRSFISLDLIHGELVPILQMQTLNSPAYNELSGKFGCGVNASLDRGFFWLGIEGIFATRTKNDLSDSAGWIYFANNSGGKSSEQDLYGTTISFGIERNIWWDWLVMRVGGKKDIHFIEEGSESYIYTNPIANGTPQDHVGIGLGINIEEKLKVDAVIAEDVLFTGGNLLSGPHHHILSRISATYAF